MLISLLKHMQKLLIIKRLNKHFNTDRKNKSCNMGKFPKLTLQSALFILVDPDSRLLLDPPLVGLNVSVQPVSFSAMAPTRGYTRQVPGA